MTDAPDFWSLYVPDENVPDHLRRFLHRDRHIGEQSLAYYAYGYSRSFEELVVYALKIWPRAEYLRLPLFFLARHSAELHLKNVIAQFSSEAGQTHDAASTHSLLTLWNRATQLVPLSPEDQWSSHVGRLIAHLHEFDPDGQRFRYPADNKGLPFAGTRVELTELAQTHGSITLWTEGACDMLDAGRL